MLEFFCKTAMLEGKPKTLSGKRYDFCFAFRLRWRRLAAVLIMAIGIVLAVLLRFQIHQSSSGRRSLARLDQPLPSLKVETSGIAVDLKHAIAGARCVIVFYSPSCRTCREVLPALHPFPDSLRLIMINESTDRVVAESSVFSNATHFHDRWGVLSRSFAVAALPTILLVDEGGILRRGIVGSHDPDFVRRELKAFAVIPPGGLPEKP